MKQLAFNSDKTTTLLRLKNHVKKFIHERDWSKYHNAKNLSVSIAIEAAELMELFQWVSDKQVKTLLDNDKRLGEIEMELADIIIYCLSLANSLNIDVSQAVTEKLDENAKKYPIARIKGNYKKYNEL